MERIRSIWQPNCQDIEARRSGHFVCWYSSRNVHIGQKFFFFSSHASHFQNGLTFTVRKHGKTSVNTISIVRASSSIDVVRNGDAESGTIDVENLTQVRMELVPSNRVNVEDNLEEQLIHGQKKSCKYNNTYARKEIATAIWRQRNNTVIKLRIRSNAPTAAFGQDAEEEARDEDGKGKIIDGMKKRPPTAARSMMTRGAARLAEQKMKDTEGTSGADSLRKEANMEDGMGPVKGNPRQAGKKADKKK